ncbi:HD domain-containing protein [Candidatus Acetothermia bacterium]|nr:HD domain-containing protein [Candidatus Acetothermia bacterium]MBI3643089.1 HD domain-containing protein [Candidatus Acetothermia bacterium]
MEKVFRDPVHNLLGFDRKQDKLILDLIETREVQRLRSIKLMGVSYLVYPGADHNRFSHSLGAAFLMKRIIERIRNLRDDPPFKKIAKLLDEHRELMLAAALLHDIGHFPLSHLLERFTKVNHEVWTTRLIANPQGGAHQVLMAAHRDYPKLVQAIIERTFMPSFAVKLISSQLDVDRMDYLLRDSYHTGVGYGQFDLEWLIHSLRIVEHEGDWEIAVDSEKGLRAVESYVLARYYMYEQVYHHKTGRSAGVLVIQILRRAAELLKNKKSLFVTDPLRKLLTEQKLLTPDDFLHLDDTLLGFAMREWQASSDPILSDLCRRFMTRQLFKTHAIDPQQYVTQSGKLESLAERKGFDPEYYLVLDRAFSDPYEDGLSHSSIKEVSESIYLVDREMKLAELSKHSDIIRAITNRPVEQDQLCFPVELRDEIEELLS